MQYKGLKYFCVQIQGPLRQNPGPKLDLCWYFFSLSERQHIDLLKFSRSPLHWETDVESLRNKFAVTFSPSSNQNMCTAYKSLPALQRRSRTTCTMLKAPLLHNLCLLESAHLWHRTGSLRKIFMSAQFQWGCGAIHLSPSQASKYCKYCKWCQASPSQAQKCLSFLLQERSVQRVECPNDICATSHASLQPMICRIFQHSVLWNSEGNVRIEQSPTQTFHIQHGVNNMN